MVYRGLYSYRQGVRVITVFPNIFSYCFCLMLSGEFAKVFERKVWSVQVAHLHNAARALSSPSRCFQLSRILGKDFFRYLWSCDKKTNRMWFSVVLVKFHWFGINWHVFRQRVSVITLLPNIVFVLFLYVEQFCKSFWMESLTRTSSSFA